MMLEVPQIAASRHIALNPDLIGVLYAVTLVQTTAQCSVLAAPARMNQ